jgi:hypothetical protein
MLYNNNTSELQTIGSDISAYYPLFLMIVGTVLNFLTFIILCRSSFKDTKKQPVIHYMRTIAIFDILILYGWNLDHYLSGVYGFTLEQYSISSCKFFLFFGYFTVQTTAWLRVFVCIDRYLSLSRLHKTWFSHSKHVIIIIICIISFLALFNLHLMIFGCFYTSNGIIDINSQLYEIFPMWDYVDLVVYNCLPFLLMVIFNSGAIYHLTRHYRTTMVQNSRIRHRSISITLFTTTFLFLIMTVPANIIFAFFQTVLSPTILRLADGILFTYYITSFPLYMITCKEFRQVFITIITCGKNTAKVAPRSIVPIQGLSAPAMINIKTAAQFMRHINTQQNA